MSNTMDIDIYQVFDQYLRDVRIPVFEYYIVDGSIYYKWSNVITGFDMPIEINLDNKPIKLFPETDWKYFKTIEGNLELNNNYYVKSNEIFN